MLPFIDLHRNFRDLTDAELEEPESLAAFNDFEYSSAIDWDSLLKHRRILLLAEAGSGKTREMQEQSKRLVSEGHPAFFVALESLSSDPLRDLLSATEEESFDDWIAHGSSPAWFFLDAVDELKLTAGSLDRALLHFSKAVGSHIDRAHVVVSCRPIDWRPDVDMATMLGRIPPPRSKPLKKAVIGEDSFLQPLQRNANGNDLESAEEADKVGDDTAVKTVVLLPLSRLQIKRFVECQAVADASAFIEELDKRDAWTFARRPLDLSELIASWNTSGCLGTRAEQHEANVRVKLTDAPDRPDSSILEDGKALHGAECLALALALAKRRTIKAPEQSLDVDRSEGVLDAATILFDGWTEGERKALLRRALFDPATYGRVRFHHRSVQEYLAARRLKKLRDKGMATKALFRLFFAEVYGDKVVIPSMKPIAAWLSLWDDDVRRELIDREPEALLAMGDPESLPLEARTIILRAFVAAYGDGGWRGIHIPIDEVRRLSHVDLASTIRELWGEGPTNDEVRELLLDVINQAPVKDCVDLVLDVARDPTWTPHNRAIAIRALLVCNQEDEVRKMADELLRDPSNWPDKLIHLLVTDLFPKILSADELLTLIKRIDEPRHSVTSGFGWGLRSIAKAIDPTSEKAIELRDKLTLLICDGLDAHSSYYQIHGKYDYLAEGLAVLCLRQLTKKKNGADDSIFKSCVIASRFSRDNHGRREPIGELRAQFRGDPFLRENAFWAELSFMDRYFAETDEWNRYYHAQHDSIIGHLNEVDTPWLESGLKDTGRLDRRKVALHGLLDFWNGRGRSESEKRSLHKLIKGSEELDAIFNDRTAPIESDPKCDEIHSKIAKQKLKREEKEKKRIRGWTQWRTDLMADPEGAFAPEKKLNTLHNFYVWLESANKNDSAYSRWSRALIADAFTPEIAASAEALFKEYWKTIGIELWSECKEEDRNSTPYKWIFALNGVVAEAGAAHWVGELTDEEARKATRLATLELNGLADFIKDLAESRPKEVEAVLGDELMNQLKLGGEMSHLSLLQDIAYADTSLKRALTPRLMNFLSSCSEALLTGNDRHWAGHLDSIFRVILDTRDRETLSTVADVCAQQSKETPSVAIRNAWLRGLFKSSPAKGVVVLNEILASIKTEDGCNETIETFASLFSRHNGVHFKIEDAAVHAHSLGDLVRHAYKFVRREDDVTHEGCYSPDMRDNAECARESLLSMLLATPGIEARDVILKLAEEPCFEHFPDRLRMLARERAATDSEFAPFEPEDIGALENSCEMPPNSRDGLFDVMMDRLSDLAHDIAHHDFTDRRTLRTIEEEIEMQRTLSMRLEMKANNAYSVAREDEVADLKRTDIRFVSPCGKHKAVIEIKLADGRWTVKDLEKALEDQLVQQYLRHESCKAGCLLLTNHCGHKDRKRKRKYWQNPQTQEKLTWEDVVCHLQKKAKDIEAKNNHSIRLSVVGLDLRDPKLKPAHKQRI